MHPPFMERLKEKAKHRRVWILPAIFYGVIFGATEERFFAWLNEQFDKHHQGFMHLILLFLTKSLGWVKENPALFVTTTGLLFCLIIILTAVFGKEKAVPTTASKHFQLINAKWGVSPTWLDVSGIVLGIISAGKTATINANTEVFGDPLPGQFKKLIVNYNIGAGKETVYAQEGGSLTLPTAGKIILPLVVQPLPAHQEPKITHPATGDVIHSEPMTVSGTHGNQTGNYWLVTNDGNSYWPKARIHFRPEGRWEEPIWNGRYPERPVTILLVRVSDLLEARFEDYVRRAHQHNDWTAIQMPQRTPEADLTRIDGITVTVSVR